jgi:antibiotic biosynthesis monooxygenase (ABM) superfamily enzyme
VNRNSDTNESADEGATAVITHRVREDRHADYEAWLTEIEPLCKASPGHLDWNVVRPIPSLTDTYTYIIRFDTAAHLRLWMESATRARLIEKVRPFFVTGDDVVIKSGLDFWFVPDGGQAAVPVRWKQYVATWSAIYPLALLTPHLLTPALRGLRIPDHDAVTVLISTGMVVFLMVYVVMPRYTRLLKRWLFA